MSIPIKISKLSEEKKYLAALNFFPKFGPQRLKKIKKHFPSLKEAFEANEKEFYKTGIEENIIAEFISIRRSINPEKIMEAMQKEEIKIITIDEKNYPGLLKEIYSPPPLLYYKGELSDKDDLSIAIVGSRKHTPYGQKATEEISFALAKNGLTITSGLALGIDSYAHKACLEADGRTIAVLGSGLDRNNIYPSFNRYLLDKIIASGGAIISEFSPGTPPLRHNFPQRNRIIAGISLGVLVIEAPEKSGALITAEYALEQNREVFALPGNIYSDYSFGPNKLIQSGARAITSAEDIIETFNISQITSQLESKKIIPETKEEELILSFFKEDSIYINDLVRLTKLDTNVINSTLVIMEMKGMIKNIGNAQYILAK